MAKNKLIGLLQYFSKNLLTVVGIVLIWRGVWSVLDVIDERFFGGPNILSAVISMIAGLLVLYLPDKDLDEIKKL